MQNSIVALAEGAGKVSRIMELTVPELEKLVGNVIKEAIHYGLTEKKIQTLSLKDLKAEIDRRIALNAPKEKHVQLTEQK